MFSFSVITEKSTHKAQARGKQSRDKNETFN